MREQATILCTKRLVGVAAAVLLTATVMIPSMAFADPSSAELQVEAQATLASLNAMQAKLDEASANHFEAQQAQQEAEAKSAEAQDRIDEATSQISDLQQRLGDRVRGMYRTGESSLLDLLFGSTTFQAFASNLDLLNHINKADADLVQQTKDLRAEVEQQKSVYAEEQRIATEKAAEAERLEAEAQATVASMQATYDSLSTEAAAALEQERAAQEAAQAAQAQTVVEAAVQQAVQANGGEGEQTGGTTNSGGTAVETPSTSAPEYNEPIAGSVVERAYSQLGKPYGYDDPSYGAGPTMYDCSGFVSFCLSGSYSRMGSTYTFLAWSRVSDPQPGDVAVNEQHCGIYIGGGQMIHSATYGVGVIIGPVQSGMVFVRP